MKKNGFTIIEMTVAVGIFALAGLMVTGVLIVGQRIKQKVDGVRVVQEEARSAAELIAREIEAAEPASLIVADQGQGRTYADTLKLYRYDTSGAKMIEEIFQPSVDSRYINMLVGESSFSQPVTQRLTSNNTIVKKLEFSRVSRLPGGGNAATNEACTVYYVEVTLALEEAKAVDATVGGSWKVLDNFLGKPATMELHFSVKPSKQMVPESCQ